MLNEAILCKPTRTLHHDELVPLFYEASLYARSKDIKLLEILAVLFGGEEVFAEDKLESATEEGYIDYRSIVTAPRLFNREEIAWEYVRDLLNYLRQHELLSLSETEIEKKVELMRLVVRPDSLEEVSCVARKDESSWIVFNQQTGSQTIINFEGESSKKLMVPVAVDMKITGYCPFGCKYCYESSTIAGEHASLESIRLLIERCAREGVFEIAFGGGEPTLHPDFMEILKICAENKLVPSFTTRNTNVFKEALVREALLSCNRRELGGIAFSVDSVKDINRLAESLKASDIRHKAVFIQIVMGTVSQEMFEQLFLACEKHSFNMSFLGFKSVGFGETFPGMIEYREWLVPKISMLLKRGRAGTIVFDTVLFAQLPESQLDNLPSWSYEVREGQHTMFIDAVTKKAYPSSNIVRKEENAVDLDGFLNGKNSLSDVFHDRRMNF